MSDIDICARASENLMTVAQAVERIKAAVSPISVAETAPLQYSLGRVLAADLHAPIDLPPFRNAAMDGYALNRTHATQTTARALKVAGTSWAGRPFKGSVPSGCCIRVFTGALVPDNADTVIMQELVRRAGDDIFLPENIPAEHHVRQRGEDVRRGDTVLKKDRQLSPADMGLLAALGFCEVPVKRKPRVAFFSTGDELRATSAILDSGEIHDSNRYLLNGMMKSESLDIRDLGIVRDDRAALKTAMTEAAAYHDVVITTGGASVGEADFIHEILAETGRVHIWKVAMKPGKPLTFGNIGDCLFFGLPGNPVSVFASYRQFVLPALHKLMGSELKAPLHLRVRCGSKLGKSPGRMEFQRGILRQDADGELSVVSAGKQGSHILGAMSKANCFIILPAENSGVEAGEIVEVEPFDTYL